SERSRSLRRAVETLVSAWISALACCGFVRCSVARNVPNSSSEAAMAHARVGEGAVDTSGDRAAMLPRTPEGPEWARDASSEPLPQGQLEVPEDPLESTWAFHRRAAESRAALRRASSKNDTRGLGVYNRWIRDRRRG